MKPESGNKPMMTHLPSEKKVREPVQSEIPMEGKADDVERTDDIIRVDVPANARLLMNPMALEENGQILIFSRKTKLWSPSAI